MNRDRLPPLRRSFACGMLARVLLPLFGMALVTTGLLGVLSFAVLPLVDLLRTQNWVAVPATVESVSRRPPRTPLHPPLDSLEISYRYSLNGSTHHGARFDLQEGLYDAQAAGATVAELSGSPAITVWVNPAAPDQAIAHRELRWPLFLLALPALVLLVIGVAMVYRGMLAWTGGRAMPPSAGEDR